MPSFNRVAALCITIMVAAITLTGVLAQSIGSIRLQIVKAGFIVGVGGGSGTLNFQGKQYQLSIGGINVGTIGASAVDLTGTAENLRTAADIVGTYSQGSAALAIVVATLPPPTIASAADIVGTYSQGSAALAIVGGGRVATLQNANGVVIKVSGPEVGLEASLSLSGMTISMQ